MRQIIKVSLLSFAALLMSIGCMEDQTYYENSKYTQLNIAKLQNISSHGYRIQGAGEIGNQSTYVYLYFCKDNKYIYTDAHGKYKSTLHKGSYRVDLANDEIVMTSDEMDNQKNHLHGSIKTASGYLEQKKRYTSIGLNLLIYEVDKINDSNCVFPDYIDI